MSEHTPLTKAEHPYAPCKSREEALDELSGHAFNVWCKTNEDTQDDEVIDMFRREFAPWLDRIVKGATDAARTPTATADTGLRERVEVLIGVARRQATKSTGARAEGFLAGLDCAMDALADATAAPTTDTGARDE